MFPSAFINTSTVMSISMSASMMKQQQQQQPQPPVTPNTPISHYHSHHQLLPSHLASLNVYSNLDLLGVLQDQQQQLLDSRISGGSVSSGSVGSSVGSSGVGGLSGGSTGSSSNDDKKQTQLHCKEEIIRWLVGVLVIDQLPPSSNGQSFFFFYISIIHLNF